MKFKNLKIRTKLLSAFFVTALITIAIGIIAGVNIKHLDDSDTALYEKMTVPLQQLQGITDAFQRVRVNIRDMIMLNNVAEMQPYINKINERRAEVDKLSNEFAERIASKETQKLYDEFLETRKQYRPLLDRAMELAKLNMDAKAIELISENGEMGKVSRAEQDAIEALVKNKVEDAKNKVKSNTDQANATIMLMIIFMILGAVASVVIGLFMSKVISNPMLKLTKAAEQISEGNTDVDVESDSTDEIGNLMLAFEKMVDNIKEQTVAVEKIAAGDLEINIMPKSEKDILNKSINVVIQTLKRLVYETGVLTEATVQGRLDTRGNANEFKGGYKDIVEGVNRTLDSVIGPLNVAAEYVDRISKGDIPAKITDTYYGDFNEIKNNLNICIDAVNALVADANMLSVATVEGRLDTRADASKHGGDFAKIVNGVNKTLDSVIGPLNVAAEYVDRISKGDIPAKITDTYYGDFNEIKNNLNICIDAVNALVADANMLSVATVEGRLDTRADASKHGGDFAKIIKGVNNTLDVVVDKVFWYEAMLDSIPFPISVTDLDMNWTFINKPVENLLNVSRKEVVGKQCSNWNAGICKTENCGIAALRRNKLQTLFEQQGLNFQVDTSYINNQKGQRVGHIEVVQDITARVKGTEYQSLEVERLASNLSLLAEGNLDFDLNIADGNEYTKVERENFLKINENLAKVKNALNALIADANMLSVSAVEGKLSTRADASKHGGDFAKIVDGFNKTLDSVIGPLNTASAHLEKLANGDNLEELDVNKYNGDFKLIINNINKVRTSLYAMLDDTLMLAEAALAGKLSTRANVTRHKGGYKQIVEGVNNTLDAVIKPIQEATEVLSEMSKGNLNVAVKGNFQGDHAIIKNALNDTIQILMSYIGEITNTLNEMAKRNLDISIERDYLGNFSEIKNSINLIVNVFNEILQDMNNAAEQVAAGSKQVSNSSQMLSQGATEQAGSIDELTASITQIAVQTKQNAANAGQANEISAKARDNAAEGNSQMQEMLKAMDSINDSSSNINRIIRVIDDIAFQTNILALNAAVEAARAGQHGKGFAVVAEEVRSLAAKSANAAKETTMLIEGSIKNVEMGTKIANNTAVALHEIVNGVSKAATLVEDIAAASNEQATAIFQVSQGVEQVSKVVQNNSSTAEESAAASEELSSQSVLLKEMVNRFTLKGGRNNYNSNDYTANKFVVKKEQKGFSSPTINLDSLNFGKY